MQTPTENRESARRAFAVSALGAGITLTALGGDASFRRYFRVQDGDRSFILMDAPPEHGGVALFQTRSDQFRTCGLPVPEIYAADTAQGLLLLQDYGDRWLYHDLVAAPEAAMTQAFALLGDWQQATANLRDAIPPYETARLHTEAALMREWFLPWLGIAADSASLQALETRLAEEVSDNAVCVHRDYHCRNLMRCNDGRIGILDYQDALWGLPVCRRAPLGRSLPRPPPSGDSRARLGARLRCRVAATPPESAGAVRPPRYARRQKRVSGRPAARARLCLRRSRRPAAIRAAGGSADERRPALNSAVAANTDTISV